MAAKHLEVLQVGLRLNTKSNQFIRQFTAQCPVPKTHAIAMPWFHQLPGSRSAPTQQLIRQVASSQKAFEVPIYKFDFKFKPGSMGHLNINLTRDALGPLFSQFLDQKPLRPDEKVRVNYRFTPRIPARELEESPDLESNVRSLLARYKDQPGSITVDGLCWRTMFEKDIEGGENRLKAMEYSSWDSVSFLESELEPLLNNNA